MFDIDGLAKQVLDSDDFFKEHLSSSEEVFELREKKEDSFVYYANSSILDHETSDVLKTLDKTPNKLYRIGEVVSILNVKDSTLRYWEAKFPEFIKPSKNKGGQRLYNLKEIKYLLKIKNLVNVEKLSIEGTKKKLNSVKNYEPIQSVSIELLYIVKDELESIQASLIKNFKHLSRLDSGI